MPNKVRTGKLLFTSCPQGSSGPRPRRVSQASKTSTRDKARISPKSLVDRHACSEGFRIRSHGSATLVGYAPMSVWVFNPSENGPKCSSQEGLETDVGISQLWLCRGTLGTHRTNQACRPERSPRPSNCLPSGKVHFGAKIPVGSRHNLIQLTEPGD